MPEQVMVRVLCDPCFDNGEETEGEKQPPAQIGSMKPRTVILCEVHRKEFVDPYRDLLQKFGVTFETAMPLARGRKKQTSEAAPDGGEALDVSEVTKCPYPGCTVDSVSNNALRGHVSAKHPETTLDAMLGLPTPHQCPECPKAFSTPQGLGAHRKSVHGVVGTSGKHAH